jgi:hypothetical protein
MLNWPFKIPSSRMNSQPVVSSSSNSQSDDGSSVVLVAHGERVEDKVEEAQQSSYQGVKTVAGMGGLQKLYAGKDKAKNRVWSEDLPVELQETSKGDPSASYAMIARYGISN